MREYQQKYLFRRLLYSRVTAVMLFVICILLLRSIMELNAKRAMVRELYLESKTERQELEAKVARAEDKNASISTDRGFESYVRTTYPVVKQGEGVIVIYDEEKSPVAPVRQDVTMWERIKIVLVRLFAKE